MPDSISDRISTTGRVTVGSSVTGEIETPNDRDAYAVELVAGRTYRIDLEGVVTDKGTLANPFLRWLRDETGTGLVGTRDDNGGAGANARQTFTPEASGTYYISARGKGDGVGTYTLTVTDTTPQAPVFGASAYAFDLAENADGSTTRVSLGTVAATDPEGATPTYSLVGDSGSFDIDAASGELFYTGAGEDYESDTTSFTLTVRASDGSETTDTTVTVTVTDVNETPTFADASYTFALAENADGSTNRVSLGAVAAVDPERATLGYSLVGDSGSFAIDEASGELFYAGAGEDFEAGTTQFTLTVRASDGSETTDTTVTVNVTDVNETPTFADASYTFDLAENTDGSTNRVSLGTVAATDPEGTTLVYSLVGDSGSFDIDEASGELFYAGAGEDFESGATRFALTVRASDGNLTTDTSVTVNVPDVEEAVDPPVSQPQEAALQTVSEPEDEDFSRDTSTNGRVVVGETATGAIGSGRDRDWFTVDLVAGRSYTIDLRGIATDDGTLRDPYLYGIHDAAGNLIAHTKNDDGGHLLNSRVAFTATASGTHYIAAGAFGHSRGTYEVEVTDNSPVTAPPASGESETPIVEEVETTETDSTVPPPSGESGTPIVRVADASATEGEDPAILFHVTLDRAPAETVTVNYTTVDGTAEAGEDYEQTSGALTFAAGETEKFVKVDVIDDEVEDSGETFRFVLSDPSGGQLGDTEATGTIFNTEHAVDETTLNADVAGNTSTQGRVSVNGGTATTYVKGNGGNVPDRDWYRVELEADTTYRIDIGGDRYAYLEGMYNSDGGRIPQTFDSTSGPNYRPRLYYTPDEDGYYFIAVSIYGKSARGSGTVTNRLTVVTADPEDDYSDDTDTTGRVTVDGATVTGEVTYTRDRDWFEVDFVAGTTYEIVLRGRGNNLDELDFKYLRGIHDSNGNLLPDTQDFGGAHGQAARVTFTATETGAHYIAASGHSSYHGTYELEVDTM